MMIDFSSQLAQLRSHSAVARPSQRERDGASMGRSIGLLPRRLRAPENPGRVTTSTHTLTMPLRNFVMRRRLPIPFVGSVILLMPWVVACGGDSAGVGTVATVAGATYTLQMVADTQLPTRFEPCDDPAGIANARITNGGIQFGANGRVVGEWRCTGDGNVSNRIDFSYPYEQDGARVLIHSYGDDFAPDTAEVSGGRLSFRGQFFRGGNAAQRYVLPMLYVRQ